MSDAYPDGGLGHVCADKRTMGYFGPAVNMSRKDNCHNVTAPGNRSDRSGSVREVLVPSIAKKIMSQVGAERVGFIWCQVLTSRQISENWG